MNNNYLIDDNDPFYWAQIIQHPNYRVIGLDVQQDIHNMLQLLFTAINRNVWRQFTGEVPINPATTAVFLIQSLDNPNISWALNHGRFINPRTITVENVIEGLESLLQSEQPTENFYGSGRFKIGFVFPTTANRARGLNRIVGRGKTKIPKWITTDNRTNVRWTWTEQVLYILL
jgi:hypothetical protein